MAMTYQNFASLGVNLNRQKYGPLDISNVFTSAADLKYYLTKGTFTEGVSEYWYKSASEKVVPYPYEGQVLATVIDGIVNVYVLSLDTDGNFQTQEIAGKLEVDGKTIKFNADGKLELVGVPSDVTGKTFVPSLVNGELTWAEPDTSVTDAQAEAIANLQNRTSTLETIVGDSNQGLVKDTSDNKSAIEAETLRAEAAEKDIIVRIEGIDFVDTKELAEALKPINAAIETKAEKSALEALDNKVNSFLTGTGATDALDSLQELIEYIDTHDDVDINKILASIQSIENKLVGIDSTVANYVTAAIDALKIGDYAKAADVNQELAKKIETGSISHTSNGVPEGVTVDGTTLKIVVDAYTKQETVEYVTNLIQETTGGVSAAAVLDALNKHIDTYDKKVEELDVKNASQDAAIEKAQADATKGINAAAELATNLAALDARVVINATDIQTINETVSSLQKKDTELAALLSGIDNRLVSAETNITSNSNRISTINGQIEDLVKEDARLDAVVTDLASSKANVSDVYTKDDVYTKEEADAAFMNQDEVDARINALIVGADPEGGKAITNIQNLVKYVDENASEIAALITATKANTDKLTGINTTVKDYVDAQIASVVVPKASDEVTVAEDGTLGIGKVSTDKLVQGEETLVLDGGSV